MDNKTHYVIDTFVCGKEAYLVIGMAIIGSISTTIIAGMGVVNYLKKKIKKNSKK